MNGTGFSIPYRVPVKIRQYPYKPKSAIGIWEQCSGADEMQGSRRIFEVSRTCVHEQKNAPITQQIAAMDIAPDSHLYR